jgi:NHL repeat
MVLAVLILAAVGAPQANAEAPEFLLTMPEDASSSGGGAAQMTQPRGVAGDPETGHVYVAEYLNARVSEYTAWGLFVRAWGWDVAPDGSPGDTPTDEFEICGPATPESDPPANLCQSGDPGAGNGQFALPTGIAVDGDGNVYVFDESNLRIQKFNSSGQFQLMFGGDVNQTKVGEGAPPADQDVCPVDHGDICQAGISGEDPSQLFGTLGDYVAYDPDNNTMVVGDKDRIQVFNLDGTYKEEIPFQGPLAAFAGETVNGLDVDEDGNIYFTLSGVEDVYKVSETGEPLSPGKPGGSSFDVKKPLGVAVDSKGNVYTVEIEVLGVRGRYVFGFRSDGSPIDGLRPADEFAFFGDDITAIAANECAGSGGGNLYVGYRGQGLGGLAARVDAYGAGPVGCEPPPKRPPEISDQLASRVGMTDATVRASINPRFWTDTAYYVEYGTGKCSDGKCPNVEPLVPSPLTTKVVNRAVLTAGVVLKGLQLSSDYHFRFVAQSGGGGPIYGVDPDEDGPAEPDPLNGLEGTFRTRNAGGGVAPCANDAFRIGPDSQLPDCRAYEMVSPLEKGNGDVALWKGRNAVDARFMEIDQASVTGDRFTFTSSTAFGDSESAPFVAQYQASRSEGGWSSQSITPPRTESPVLAVQTFGNDYSGFSEDLCTGWFRHFSVAPLTSDATAGYANLYQRSNCSSSPSYKTLTTGEPQHDPSEYSDLSGKGSSGDSKRVIFAADAKLDPSAPSLEPEELLLYEHSPDGLRFVCFLPSGKASPEACAAGTLAGGGVSDISSLKNAISADGSRIFWTAYSGKTTSAPDHPGQIYVRIDGTDTVRISGSVATSPAFYWTASDDGSKAIFEFTAGPFKDQLYEFDVDTKTPKLIAGGVEGPMGASEDASRIYFASTEDLDDTGPANAGDHNLYLYEADPAGGTGSFTFIMELAARDIALVSSPLGRLTAINSAPGSRSARVSPDGLHATFVSVASPTPTDFDNREASSGEPAQEVYLYDAAEGELRCVSCNATGARPTAENTGGLNSFWTAARIQGWEANLHAPRVLTDDGTRVFFESFEALVPRDTNATWDVYQWEEPGKGSCKEASETFSAVTGGCVDLISSGQSPVKSTFLDADPTGDSIFFSTQSSLISADYGLNDVYVARVGGGFPEPPPHVECEGEACQSPPPPPPTITPASESFRGADRPKARKCPKGKRRVVRKGKARCVKRKANRASKQRKGGRR